MKKVRLGFVGCGTMGQRAHLENYATLPDVELVALADLRPQTRELVARVRAVLRRYAPVSDGSTTVGATGGIGSFALDEVRMRITLHGQVLNITPMEFRVLAVLLEQPGRIWSRAQLLEHIQPAEMESYDRVIDTHIKNLRKKITVIEPGSNYIRSVYGVGYKLELCD